MPSLEDLEKSPPKSRLERSFSVVLDATLVRKVADLAAQSRNVAGSKKPADRQAYRRMITELEGLQPQVEAASGTLVLRANLTQGEWTRFVDSHPARPEGQKGHERDQRWAYGVVNVDALIEHLDQYAHMWENDTLEPTERDKDGNVTRRGQFDRLLRDNIPPGDLNEMAAVVVLFYETSPDFASWRSALSSGLQRLRDFAEQETSESLRSDSQDGSPDESSEDSTETETPAP